MSDSGPPGGIDAPSVGGKSLNYDDGGEGVEIDLANAAIHDAIAQHAEQDQAVEDWVEQVVIENVIEAANGSVHEMAGRDEEKRPMVYGFPSEIDRRPDARAEDDHVAERNRKERINARLSLMEHGYIEAGHDDGDYDAQHNHP